MPIGNIDTSAFAPKDAKIIRENPDKEVYELITLGLSEKASNRLLDGDYKEIADVKEPVKQEAKPKIEQPSNVVKPTVEPAKKQIGKPILSKPNAIQSDTTVNVHNSRTGLIVKMSRAYAMRAMKTDKNLKLV